MIPPNLQKPWLFLAPMDGVADWAFREVCYGLGAEIAVSHLVPVAGLLVKPLLLLQQIGARHGSRPFAVQLHGRSPADFRRAARLVTDSLPIVGIDINMGCPAPLIVGKGSGSALLRDPERAASIVAEACAGTHLPVSVKLRTGWDSTTVTDLAPLLEAAGAKLLTIHGRTRAQLYRGEPDHEAIAAVKRAVSIPVVGNGDVVSCASARKMLDLTGVDGIMVGRGAKGNPWLFAELQALLKGNDRFQNQAPSPGELIREHARLAFDDLGPATAPLAIRKHFAAYARNSPSAAVLRKELRSIYSWDDAETWIAMLEASYNLPPGRSSQFLRAHTAFQAQMAEADRFMQQ